MECEICGCEMERHVDWVEYWGSMVSMEDYECVNPNCGEESEEEE